jgi:N-acetylmuramoyl-L-alanine amidase
MVWPIFWAMVSSLSLLVQTDRSMAKQELFESYKKIIVLDPGHGGQDSGAKGPDKTLEKKVVLELARKVAAELEPEFKVVLTRTDDYHVDLYNRTAIANHIKANLFISIHTGAGFTHSTSGTALYYYQNFNRTDNGQVPPATDKNPHQPLLWKNIQIKYVEQSQALARIVAGRIGKGTTGLIRVEGSPLTVLQGAAMPAVLIEIGHITNPTEEKKLRDQRFLLELAGQISSGIEEFMVQNAK